MLVAVDPLVVLKVALFNIGRHWHLLQVAPTVIRDRRLQDLMAHPGQRLQAVAFDSKIFQVLLDLR
jgi:hypothetical protein